MCLGSLSSIKLQSDVLTIDRNILPGDNHGVCLWYFFPMLSPHLLHHAPSCGQCKSRSSQSSQSFPSWNCCSVSAPVGSCLPYVANVPVSSRLIFGVMKHTFSLSHTLSATSLMNFLLTSSLMFPSQCGCHFFPPFSKISYGSLFSSVETFVNARIHLGFGIVHSILQRLQNMGCTKGCLVWSLPHLLMQLLFDSPSALHDCLTLPLSIYLF